MVGAAEALGAPDAERAAVAAIVPGRGVPEATVLPLVSAGCACVGEPDVAAPPPPLDGGAAALAVSAVAAPELSAPGFLHPPSATSATKAAVTNRF